MWPRVSDNPRIQQHYEACRAVGTSHLLAEMFAFRQGPALMTDDVFLEGRHAAQAEQFNRNPEIADAYKGEADAAGVDITGKVYLSGLAAYPGDPKAWVSGRGDVQRVCEERGWSCKGAVNVKGEHIPAGSETFHVHPELVAEHAQARALSDPAFAELPAEERTEQTRAELSPRPAPPPE